MNVRIRPFTESDYPAIVEIGNRVFPEYLDTVEEVRYWDTMREAKCRFQRYVAERKGRIIAVADYSQHPWTYHPQKFDIHINVVPEHQKQGIGSALYEHLMVELQPFDPITVRSRARQDYEQSVRFLAQRGFVEVMRTWESRLEVQRFDFSGYEGCVERLEAQGIRLVPLSELLGNPDCQRELYEMEKELGKDVPHVDAYTPISFEVYVKRFLQSPDFFPEAWYIALDGDRYAGMSALWKSQASPQELYTGLTGVRREYRRRGIALALKLKTIAYAKAQGYRVIKTWNESNNRPMLSINEQLGYAKQPAWITFAKELKDAPTHSA